MSAPPSSATSAKTSAVISATFSTDFVTYPSIPIKYTEVFNDAFCNDNTPMDLSAHITLQLNSGYAPILHTNYGFKWYDNVVKEVFREIVRNFISTYDMYTLTSNREVYDSIKIDIADKLNVYFDNISKTREFPVSIVSVVVDKAKPNDDVMNELNNTAKMAQEKLTQIKKQEVEDQRKITEHKRALADMEYLPQWYFDLARFLLENGSIFPRNVVYQAHFKQGKGVYYEKNGEFFCYG